MSTPTTSDYLLLSRGQWDKGADKAAIEAAIGQFYAWYEANIAKGIFKPGSRLTTEAAIVTRDGIRSDGPFAEGKEVIGGCWIIVAGSLAESKESIAGYFLLAVDSTDAAVKLAQACPILAHGAQIEVRPIADLCRPMADVKAMGNE